MPAGLGIVQGPGDVREVVAAVGGVGLEKAQAEPTGAAALEMMIADGLPQAAGAAVQHQPEPSVLVRLKLEEVVSAAEGAELNLGLAPAHAFERGRGEVAFAESLRQGGRSVAAVAHERDGFVEPGQDPRGRLSILDT